MKKGFTLIELLAVLVIIGAIIMISVPTIGSVINTSKDKAYERQVATIINAARTYMSNHSKDLPDKTAEAKVTVSKLKEEGLISNNDILNPKESGQKMNGCVIITFDEEHNKYIYNYNNEENACD